MIKNSYLFVILSSLLLTSGYSQCTICNASNPSGPYPTIIGITCITVDQSYQDIIQGAATTIEICDAFVLVAGGISGFVNISVYGTGSLAVGSGISAGTLNTSNCANDGTIKAGGSNLDPSGYGCTPLPVELIKFTSQVNSNITRLEWTTATELNNDYFLVYRSTDLETWNLVGLAGGSGTTNHEVNYEFVDRNLENGTYYYRLIQTDYDGTQSTSNVVSAEINVESSQFSIYPNPTNDDCVIASDVNISNITIKDSFGQVALTLEGIDNNSIQVQTSTIEQGVYYIEVETENGNQTKKLVRN